MLCRIFGMGHHYVPKRYLRSFEIDDNPNFVWLYDKKSNQPRAAAIDKVAQKRGFYDPEVEARLNTKIELPGSAVIEKLCGAFPITDAERWSLTVYIGTMMMRVPDRRERAKALIPSALAKSRERVRDLIMAAGKESDADPELVSRRLAENDEIVARLAVEPPSEVIDLIRTPWPTPKILDAIYGMTWRVLAASGPSFFVTTDNPVFFFRAYGLGTDHSELALPLSTKHVLHGCRQPGPSGITHLLATEQFVQEVNRRMVSAATRLVFYHENAHWLEKLVRKVDFRLNHVVW